MEPRKIHCKELLSFVIVLEFASLFLIEGFVMNILYFLKYIIYICVRTLNSVIVVLVI